MDELYEAEDRIRELEAEPDQLRAIKQRVRELVQDGSITVETANDILGEET